MAQTLDEARRAAAAAIIGNAQEHLSATVPLADQITGSMLIGQFMTQNPPNAAAAAMLTPLFDFVLAVQREAQPFIAQALAAMTIEDAYAASDAYKPTIAAPTLDVWGAKYP